VRLFPDLSKIEIDSMFRELENAYKKKARSSELLNADIENAARRKFMC